jgi:hypothetical protein
MDEAILREIVVEIAEMEKDFSVKLEALRRKLRIALGDIQPRRSVVTFKGNNGKTFEVRT